MIALWLACARPQAVDPSDDVVARVPVADAAEFAALDDVGDVWTEVPRGYADVRVPRSRLAELDGAEVWIDDLAGAAERARGGGDGFFEDWRTLDEIEAHLDSLADGDVTRVVVLGRSVERRPIHALEIDLGPVDDRPGLLITAAMHAREWVAAASAVWIADHLVTARGSDPVVDALLARYRVTVVPVVNPDGYDHSWTTDRYWRKSRRDNGDGTFGVDLNRNFAVGFGGPGSAGATVSGNYRGPAAFSEPEADAIRRFVDDHPRYALHVDLHCTGQLVLSPWGFTDDPPPDAGLLFGGAETAAEAMSAALGTVYVGGPTNTTLYPAGGMGVDWTYGAHGLNSWLLELRDEGQYGFLLPAEQLVPTAQEAWAGVVHLADIPPARMGLQVPEVLVAGSPARLTTSRSAAGATARIWWSATGPGTTVVPSGVELDLADPRLLGEDEAGRRGWAAISAALPASASGRTLAIQAEDGAQRSIVVFRVVP